MSRTLVATDNTIRIKHEVKDVNATVLFFLLFTKVHNQSYLNGRWIHKDGFK